MSEPYEEKNTPFGLLLQRRFHEFGMRYPGRFKSAVEFGRWLGFKQSTFSTWWSGSKVPTDSETIEAIADKLGVEVYDALGLARKMPKEERTNFIASTLDKLPEAQKNEVVRYIWDHLSPEYQDKWFEIVKKYLAEDHDPRMKRDLA